MPQTCTLCYWCTTHVGTAAHIMLKNPSCLLVDEGHIPTPPKCICTIDHVTGQWIHTTTCPKHP